MGFKESAQHLATKLRLDKHHTAERLAVNTGVLAITGALFFGLAGTAAVNAAIGTLGTQAIYTSSFTSSKTQTQGDVVNVYRSTDGTRALALMQVDETTASSSNATDYQAFVTASSANMTNQELSTPDVTGEIVVFGSTGYMGLVLDAAEPFHEQIVNATFRANAELIYTPGAPELSEDMEGDSSFSEYDQWRTYFNPGASKAVTAKSLDAKELDLADVYYETVLSGQEAEARDELDGKLAEMRVALANIENETSKLSTTSAANEFLVEPQVPEQIRGDQVTGESGTAAVEEAEAQIAEDGTAVAPAEEPAATDTNEPPAEEVGTGEDSTLALESDWLAPGGYDFDWRSGSVQTGYIDELLQKDETVVEFFQRQAKEAQEGDSSLSTDGVKWMLTSGGDLTEEYSSLPALKPLVTIMNQLTSAWGDYFGLKTTYQTELLGNLLQLEMDLRSVQSSSSTTESDDAVMIY